MSASTPREAGAALRHPAVLLALGLWLLNDHVLKGSGPGWLTGKLSDVACLIVVPLIPVTFVELWRSRRGGDGASPAWVLWTAVVATGLVMVTINVWNPAAWAYRHGLGALQWPLREVLGLVLHDRGLGFAPVHLTMDPSDLWTLPALLVPVWVTRTAQERADSGGNDAVQDRRGRDAVLAEGA